jgi:threonine dehydrogenase-like Zn-dependent dehydrogenase
MQIESDKLCREYGLDVILNPKRGKSKHYGEWKAEKEGKPTYRGMMKADIDRAIAASMTERQFWDNLKKMGYTIRSEGHKDISIRGAGKDKGLKMVRKRGRFVEFSVFSQETSVDWSIIGDRKELDIAGSHISGLDGYPIAIDFLQKGIVKVDGIVTHTFPLADWRAAFELAERGDESIKVVLVP